MAYNLSVSDWESILECSRNEYPELEPRAAVEEWVKRNGTQGVFWTESDGTRCKWGPEAVNHVKKDYLRNTTRKIVKYRIPKGPFSLKALNKPNSNGYAHMTAHTSEKIDILAIIFNYALVLPKPYLIQPEVVTTNVKFGYTSPSYEKYSRTGYDGGPSEILRIDCRDKNGPYELLRKLKRPEIDASFLRTCKIFHKLGSEVLYGGNKFFFLMRQQCGVDPSIFGGEVYRPPPFKPGPDEWRNEIKEGLSQIDRHVYITSLRGWIYHDDFLRFIYTIGPRNAALIKHLAFYGTVKIHTCHPRREHHCDDDLIRSLRLYTPFLKRFCQNISTLTIYPLEDHQFRDEELPPWRPKTMEDAVTMLLERSIIKIPSLKVLRVLRFEADDGIEYGTTYDYDTSFFQFNHGRDVPYDFAEPIRKVIEERAMERERQRLLELERQKRTKQIALESGKNSEPVKCGFCGENHLWVYCHNLCNRCGSFGHFGRDCSQDTDGLDDYR
ncbi:hypothetical protein GLAREA_06393 [Glarea lozoyensis ATCC 20868]|uniref:CCHC-type domain-containing protein n=1 Tax=Glarea lozoyensis (strain ATCC 20868 / MF5171) TaxID=1116229 RepID=S3D6K4_GLAL2|nr:uncharacterized protein GLAREA_06393 [Glarea lozoyensis ATCC 20868]EPE33380.1 hypothetical protein GLAREA_06393 [Glarea lozoyensis ATCC 20868]